MPVKPPEPITPNMDPNTRVTYTRIAASLAGTADHLYSALLKLNHEWEVRTITEWKALVEKYRKQPTTLPKFKRVISIRTRK